MTMKRLLFISVIVFFASILKSQYVSNIEWSKNYGGSDTELIDDVIQTSDGGYVVLGSSRSIDIDLTGSNGGYDLWVIKTDPQGNLIWQKNYGGSRDEAPNKIIETNDGGLIIAGTTASTDGDISNNPNGGSKWWILKLDNMGNLLWEQIIAIGLGGSCLDVVEDLNGNLYFMGYCALNGTVSTFDVDITLLKMNSSGTVLWDKQYGSPNGDEYGASISPTADGGFILGSTTQPNSGTLANNYGQRDYHIIKVDGNGNFIWERNYGGTADDSLQDVVETADGGFILVGKSLSNDIDVSNNLGFVDVWVLKTNMNGIIEWDKNIGSVNAEEINDFFIDNKGRYILTAYSFSNPGDFDDNYGNYDSWILMLDQNGNIFWKQNYGGSNRDQYPVISQTQDSGYIYSFISESSDFDVNNNYGSTDIILLKIDVLGCPMDYSGANSLFGNASSMSGDWQNGDYETEGVIESIQSIPSNVNIDYDSGTLIQLQNGFNVDANANFAAFIDGCDGGGGGILLNDDADNSNQNK